MRATTLRASDPTALKNWLRENGYTVSNTQDAWFQHYIQKDWYLTAFRIVSKDPSLRTEAIRMSFPTSEPYNPYYVPKDNWAKGATLSLFFISVKPMTGYIGYTQPWRAKPQVTMKLPPNQYDSLAKNISLRASDIPANSTIVKYVDQGFAQGAMDDLFFR